MVSFNARLRSSAMGTDFSVCSHPFQPWRVRLIPIFASQRWSGRWWQFSRRSKMRRMESGDVVDVAAAAMSEERLAATA